jgi:hypothetical protein
MKEFFELPWSIYCILGAKAFIGARGELKLTLTKRKTNGKNIKRNL